MNIKGDKSKAINLNKNYLQKNIKTDFPKLAKMYLQSNFNL